MREGEGGGKGEKNSDVNENIIFEHELLIYMFIFVVKFAKKCHVV